MQRGSEDHVVQVGVLYVGVWLVGSLIFYLPAFSFPGWSHCTRGEQDTASCPAPSGLGSTMPLIKLQMMVDAATDRVLNTQCQSR